jgi:hypothetical protein
MDFRKISESVLRKSILLLLVMAVPPFAWGQKKEAPKAPAAPAPKAAAPAARAPVPAQHTAASSAHTTPGRTTTPGHTTTTGAAKPGTAKPGATKPGTTAGGTKPGATKPGATKPGGTKPGERAGAGAGKPGGATVGKQGSHVPPGRDLALKGGGTAHIRPNGQIRSVDRNGMHIEHNLHGGRTVVSEHNGARVVTTGRHGGYVQRAYVTRGGRSYYQRTYYDHGVYRSGVYRGYYYGGRNYYGYYPGYYYNPGFYAWGYNPWAGPVYWGVGAWGWGGAPWYGYYGFTPYPFYAGPAFWLTDYLIAANLQAAYAARTEANADAAAADSQASSGSAGGDAPAAASNAVTLTPEVKQAIAEEVKAQLQAEQASAGSVAKGASAGGGQAPAQASGEVPPALDPARRTFVVDTDVAVVADGQECSLTQGDVITRLTDTPDADQQVNVSIASSKKSDCAAGKMVAVKVDDLMEMHNHFQEKLDEGMKTMASKQGTGGMPKAPDTSTVASDVPPPAPDKSAGKTLDDQAASADQTESQVKQESAGAPAGGQQ